METQTVNADVKNIRMKDLLNEINSDKNGLTDEEAKTRLKKYGLNELKQEKKNLFLKILSSFWGPIPIMIEAAAVLSLIINHFTDFAIIMILLLMNVTIGFWHDLKADKAIEMLKQKLSPDSRVKRDGKWQALQAKFLVPGDIIRLRSGDIIPADAKLLEGESLETDESALTGESLPVDKKQMNEVYSGSVVVRGEMTAVVTKTGMETYLGKTAKLVEEKKEKSHFEKAVIKIGNYLIVLAVFLVVLILIVTLFRGDNLMESLRFAMVLTVASIPVALPAILTVTMALGAVSLAKKKAIVSKLASIEELAGMDILCSDKTGTLTQNKLKVANPVTAGHFKQNEVILFAALASNKEDNDAIDNAIFKSLESDKNIKKRFDNFEVRNFKPFDSVVKKTESEIIDENGLQLTVSKGAPQVIFGLIEERENELKEYRKKVDDFAKMGYRMIAVAVKYLERRWELVGLIPLFDPPREDSKDTIENANHMGIDVKMITGDNIAIAKQVSQQLGLKSNVLRADKLNSDQDHKLEEVVENADGFAEVFPEHKFSIVKILQNLGHYVGMTGDGVNDAPALKRADCGIAVSGATDAAKSAAAIVLTSPGISVIIDAVKESRKIFQRMKSYAIYRIAETLRVLFFITLSILVFNFYPVTAVMIVLLALLNDAPIMTIASDNVRYSIKPEKWNMHQVLGLGTLLGFVGVILSFLIFYIGKNVFYLNNEMVQSFVFLKLAVAGHLTIFISRTKGHFWSIKPSKMLLFSAIITKVAATFFAVYGWFIAPIGWKYALFIWGYAIIAFVLTDYLKVFYYKYYLD